MKAYLNLLIIVFLFPLLNLTAQTGDLERLKSSFSELENQNNKSSQVIFFEAFPTSFENFEATFGYNNRGSAPLYDKSYEYITKFFSLDSIPNEKYINKVVNVSIGGHWDADAVNYFQNNLRHKVFSNLDDFYLVLKEKSNKEIESFFYFFFDGIHPTYEVVPDEFNHIKTKDLMFYNYIVNGHKKAINESGH